MNNLTLGNDDFTYYETLGGGQGACAGRRRPERRARGDVEHAQHADRGARAGVPAARGGVRAAPRLGRRRARTAAATASCASSRRSREMSYSLITERRRHAPAGRRRRRAGRAGPEPAERRGAARRRRPVRCAPGDRLRIETPGGGGHGESLRRSAFLGLGIMGAPDGGEPRAGGLRADGLEPDARAGGAFAAEHGARARRRRPRRRPRAPTRRSRWSRTCPRSRRCCSATTAPPRARRGRAGDRHVDDRADAPAASIGERLGERGIDFLDAPVYGLAPEGRGRHADDHGRRRRGGLRARPAAVRGDGRAGLHVGPSGHGEMVKLINNTLAAVNAAGLAEAVRWRRRPASTLTHCSRWPPALGRVGDARPQGRPMIERDFDPLFKLEHMLKDVRHMLAEAAGSASTCSSRRSPKASTRAPPRSAWAGRTSPRSTPRWTERRTLPEKPARPRTRNATGSRRASRSASRPPGR